MSTISLKFSQIDLAFLFSILCDLFSPDEYQVQIWTNLSVATCVYESFHSNLFDGCIFQIQIPDILVVTQQYSRSVFMDAHQKLIATSLFVHFDYALYRKLRGYKSLVWQTWERSYSGNQLSARQVSYLSISLALMPKHF